MAAKAILVLCAQTLLVQSVFSQCTSRAAIDASGISAPYGFGSAFGPAFTYDGFNAPLAYDGFAYPSCASRSLTYDGFYSPAMEFTATSGGALPVTSSSAIAPIGISIVSENSYEGALLVAGELPFVGTTAMEGVLPTAGSGAINHGCGNGLNAMSALSPSSTPASVATIANSAFGASGNGYDAVIAPAMAGNAFGYNGLMSSGFAAPGLAYNGLAYADSGCSGRGLAYDGFGYDAIEITPTSGGALPVSSASIIPPTGIAVASDNAYEGALAVGGELPFVGTVGMQGVLPTAGAGAVNHACGNGRNAMISETAAFTPGAAAYGPAASAFAPMGLSALGYRNGLTGRGCAL